MEFYQPAELATIILKSADRMGIDITAEAASGLARRSRGTPRVANRLLRRTRDFAQVEGQGVVDLAIVDLTLDRLGIDTEGLDSMDRKVLETIAFKFDGGPVGIDSLATAIGEEGDTIEDVYEPFLIMCGFIQRTRAGRILTSSGRRHLGMPAPDGKLF
jgi:Holliday junction DNA helicase RuvB